MAIFRAEKVVSSLPSPLTPDTLYAVRTGAGFDLYVSDATGSVAHQINYPDPDGDGGWSPVFSVQNDGARRVLRLDDWVGGTGTKPATGDYVGASGLTNDIAQAIDIRGPQGASGGEIVALGRWEVTSAASLTADNVFDNSLYSHYTIVGQIRPATNNVNLGATLRSSTPSDVSGGLACAGYNAPMTSSSGGEIVSNQSNIFTNVSNNTTTGGVRGFWMRLRFRDSGAQHTFSVEASYLNAANSNFIAAHRIGYFNNSAPRQGIKFSFTSGNIADGWIEIVGHKKQTP